MDQKAFDEGKRRMKDPLEIIDPIMENLSRFAVVKIDRCYVYDRIWERKKYYCKRK